MTREEMMRKMFPDLGIKCCICGEPILGYGNNPYPVVKEEEARCCDLCDSMVVIPARIRAMFEKEVPESLEYEFRSASAEAVRKYRGR